jgi:hypothetical protein
VASACRICFAALVGSLTLFVAACGGDEEAGTGGESLVVELTPENGSGQSGRATLTPVGADRTRVVLSLTRAPAVPQPSHIHSGRCGDMGDPVAALESLEGGKAETTVDLSLADLQTGDLVVHAHKSDAEYEVSVACGEIPTAD